MLNAPRAARSTWTRGLSLLSGACLLATAVIFHNSATAQPGGKPPPVTAVAIVDVNRVLEQSAEWAVTRTKLQAAGEKRQSELNQLNSDIEALRKRIGGVPARSPERIRLEGELIEKNAQGEVRVKVMEKLGDIEAGPELWAIYLKINEAVTEIATQQGYEIVLADDSALPTIPEGTLLTSKAVQNATSGRQVLYKGPRADITDQVVTVLNNRFLAKAGRR